MKSKMKKVLIVIDAQEDFVRGSLGTKEAVAALPVIQKLVRCMHNNYHEVYYTQDVHGDNYLDTQEGKMLPVKHCIYHTPGIELCPEVLEDGVQYPFLMLKSSFGYTNFPEWEEWFTPDENSAIYLCGFCTDICVMANFQILKSLYPECPIYIVSDACAGVTPELHEAALKVMKSCQAIVITSEEFEKQLTETGSCRADRL